MEVATSPKRFGDHHNAFGFLRLLLASLVIVSHTPELVDGTRKREVLTRLFHTLSFGELAVDGFFVVSGFLITASFLNSAGPASFLRKRIARIYPGFVISSLVCVLLVGPLGGGYFENGLLRGLAGTLVRIATLCPPIISGVFVRTPYAALNGAAWTIQYEFFCYLVILCLGSLRLLRSAVLIGLAATGCLLVSGLSPPWLGVALNGLPMHGILTGDRMELFRLLGLFLAGSAFYLGQSRIRLSKIWAASALVLLFATLSLPRLANFGFAIFGSYVLFAAAALGSGGSLSKINNRNDISYGLYLYAWPVEKLLLWWHLSKNLFVVGAATWVLAAAAGALSWVLVEKPVMLWARRSHRVTAPHPSKSDPIAGS